MSDDRQRDVGGEDSARSRSEDIVRVLRIVEYTGPRSMVEECVSRSIHGEKRPYGPGSGFVIRAATIGEYPEILRPRSTTAFVDTPEFEAYLEEAARVDNERIRESFKVSVDVAPLSESARPEPERLYAVGWDNDGPGEVGAGTAAMVDGADAGSCPPARVLP